MNFIFHSHFYLHHTLGYWLGEPHWGKGIVTGAIKQIVDFGFKTYDIDRIFARPFGTNIASQRVLEKAGFTFETKFEKTLVESFQTFAI